MFKKRNLKISKKELVYQTLKRAGVEIYPERRENNVVDLDDIDLFEARRRNMSYNEFSKLITDVNISFNNVPTQYLSDSVCDTVYRVYDCFIDIIEKELSIDDNNFLCDSLVDMILGSEIPTDEELHTMYNYFIPELNINPVYTQKDVEYWVEYIEECNDLIKDIIDTFGNCENLVNSIGEIIDIVNLAEILPRIKLPIRIDVECFLWVEIS